MPKICRILRSTRRRWTSWFGRIATFSNVLLLTLVIGVVILVMTIQDIEMDRAYPTTPHLDEFKAASFVKHSSYTTATLGLAETTSRASSIAQNRSRSTTCSTPIAVKNVPVTFATNAIPPPMVLPAIKLRYDANYAKRVLQRTTTTEKILIPKEDFVKSASRIFKSIFKGPEEPLQGLSSRALQGPQTRWSTQSGYSQWIRANGRRERDKFLVYSAYWDDRFTESNVRVMAVMVNKNPPPVFCRLKMADGSHLDAIVQRKIMNEHWRLKYASYFLSCEVAKNVLPPAEVMVSLQRNFTYAAVLPVYRNKEDVASPRGSMAVCVKPLHYNYDRATWMLEFVEFHRALGVDHFFFYNHSVGANVDALLRSYISQSVVTVLPWLLPIRSQKEIRTEGIFSALNDCLFRTMYRFDYVIMLDFDEYIVPREHDTYQEMLHKIEEDNKRIRGKPGSFVFRNTFFYLYWENDTAAYGAEPEKPPQYLPYFVTQYKTRRLVGSMKTGSRSKYILVPDRVMEVGNHVVWRHTSGSRAIQVPDTVALLHHYRICEFGGFSCLKKTSLVDRTATRFGPDLLSRARHQCKMVYPELGGHCPVSPPLGSPW